MEQPGEVVPRVSESITAKSTTGSRGNAGMEFEKLALEVSATKAGLTPVNPPVLHGDSGVDHRFTLLFTDGRRNYAFDFYDAVTDVEVVRSFAKKFDTRASVNIVCLRGKVTEQARLLAFNYEMKVLSPEALETFFALEPVMPRSSFG